MLQKIWLTAGSLLFVACAGVPPPKGHECFLNVNSAYKLCFDLEKDYDDNGNLKAGVNGVRVPLSSDLLELHGSSIFDPDSRASLKAYGLKWKERYKDCQLALTEQKKQENVCNAK